MRIIVTVLGAALIMRLVEVAHPGRAWPFPTPARARPCPPLPGRSAHGGQAARRRRAAPWDARSTSCSSPSAQRW